MTEHDTTALLDQLVARVEPGAPPLALIVARGRRTRTRRRVTGVVAAAAAVAVLAGGTAVLARPGTSSHPGPLTSPTPTVTATQQAFEDVALHDLIGWWLPLHVSGQADPAPGSEAGLIRVGDHEVATTHACTVWGGSIDGGLGGAVVTDLSSGEMRCPPGYAEDQMVPDSSVVLRDAQRVQVAGDLLTFYGADDRVLGTYQRDWVPVRPGQLVASWRPVRLFGEEPQPVKGRMPLLHFHGSFGGEGDWVSADDGINDTSGQFEIGDGGTWSTSDLGSTLVGCLGDCQKVRNPDVIQSAVRVQLINGWLAFYGTDGHVIGLYRRA